MGVTVELQVSCNYSSLSKKVRILFDLIIKEASQLFGEEIDTILLTGSMLDATIVDVWSDTDLIIILKEGQNLTEYKIEILIRSLGEILAKESYVEMGCILKRCVLGLKKGIESLDLKVCTYDYWLNKESKKIKGYKVLYGGDSIFLPVGLPDSKTIRVPSLDIAKIDQLWFLFYECVKKLKRNDHLIGVHLLLELVQEYLVLKMQQRDFRFQTNIHRFGKSELLNPAISFSKIDLENKAELWEFIYQLACLFEKIFDFRYPSYISRLGPFREYLDQ